MAITRAQYQNLLVPGLKVILDDSYARFSDKNQHLDIYGEARKTDRAYEESLMTAQLGVAQLKTEAGAMYLDEGAGEMWKARVTMNTFALRFGISKEAIDDNQYMNPAKALTKSMGRGHAERMQLEAAAILNNATSSSYLGGDGVALAANNHPTKDGGTNSNLLTTASDFNEASKEDMELQIMDWVNQRGIKINCSIKRYILPKLYTYVAERLARSAGRVGTTDNDTNLHKGFSYSINNYLTDVDAFFGITDVSDGLVFFNRQELQPVSDMNFETQNMQYGSTKRYGFGWFDPLGVIMSAGA